MAGPALLKNAIDFKMALGIEKLPIHNHILVNSLTELISSTQYQLVGPKDHKNRTSVVSIYGDQSLEKYL